MEKPEVIALFYGFRGVPIVYINQGMPVYNFRDT